MQSGFLKEFTGKTLIAAIMYVVIKWAIIIFAGNYLYKHGLWRNEYFLFFPILAGIVWYIRWRKKKRKVQV